MGSQAVYKQPPIFEKGGQPMDFTLGSVLIIMVICIITTKWIMPLLTLRKIARALVRLVLKPFHKGAKKVEAEVDRAAAIIGEEWDDVDKD